MITRQELQGQWNQVKGQVQERWGEFSDDELMEARGSADQLVGVIQQNSSAPDAELQLLTVLGLMRITRQDHCLFLVQFARH